MELPKTSAIVGIPAADIRVRSRKIWPPGMKISFWVGRSAPPDSTRLISGSRLRSAMSDARSALAQRPRVGRAAAHGRVARDQHALGVADHADAGHHAAADREAGPVARQRRQLEERGVRVDEQLDPLAGQAACPGPGAARRTSGRRRPAPWRARRPARPAGPAWRRAGPGTAPRAVSSVLARMVTRRTICAGCLRPPGTRRPERPETAARRARLGRAAPGGGRVPRSAGPSRRGRW